MACFRLLISGELLVPYFRYCKKICHYCLMCGNRWNGVVLVDGSRSPHLSNIHLFSAAWELGSYRSPRATDEAVAFVAAVVDGCTEILAKERSLHQM